MSELVEDGKFCRMTTNRLEEEVGLSEGDVVYVVGFTFMPLKDDPYNYRKIFAVTKVVDDHLNPETKPVAVDASGMEPVDEFTEARLYNIMREDFGGEEAANS